ncbi:MAG TPA: hypothetical protein VGJ22_06170, partial [Anaerolineales bacterium]
MALLVFFANAAGSRFFSQQASSQLPAGEFRFGMFVGRFNSDGTFSVEGKDWPSFQGIWKTNGSQVELLPGEERGTCEVLGKYRFRVEGSHLSFDVV